MAIRYDSPPHVGDTNRILVLLPLKSAHVAFHLVLPMLSTSKNVAKKAEEQAVQLMKNVLSLHSGAATRNGFIQSILPEMLSEWIHFEEHTEIVVDDDSDSADVKRDEEVPQKEIGVLERISEMKKFSFCYTAFTS